MAKQYIYRQRCFKRDINFNEFMNIVIQMKNSEKYIAIKNNKYDKFAKKWGINIPKNTNVVLNLDEYITQYMEQT